jgi:hypothetical protein
VELGSYYSSLLCIFRLLIRHFIFKLSNTMNSYHQWFKDERERWNHTIYYTTYVFGTVDVIYEVCFELPCRQFIDVVICNCTGSRQMVRTTSVGCPCRCTSTPPIVGGPVSQRSVSLAAAYNVVTSIYSCTWKL